MKVFEYIAGSLIAIVSVFVVYVIVGGVIYERDKVFCLDNAFPNARQTYDFKVYCVGRLNGSDYVVPVEEIKKENVR